VWAVHFSFCLLWGCALFTLPVVGLCTFHSVCFASCAFRSACFALCTFCSVCFAWCTFRSVCYALCTFQSACCVAVHFSLCLLWGCALFTLSVVGLCTFHSACCVAVLFALFALCAFLLCLLRGCAFPEEPKRTQNEDLGISMFLASGLQQIQRLFSGTYICCSLLGLKPKPEPRRALKGSK